ncbi:bacterial extracellular solute-binding protein, family 3 family protein 1 [Achromobacter xylosoxidans A8]|uniref:Bacterial extracellular solute-binding protein, family 3 family protein 1 n=1 Tax=Achromobacter xylosoxidans (strain A8) TaxID=762376 RepID=E3HMX0_ACHXA|nr:bacterial extracellular solute-binding protein, family 3 family protein 1 [Achromobacter xylosoxidans A8]
MFTQILVASRLGVAHALGAFMLCTAAPMAFGAATIKADSLTVGSDLTYPPYAYMDGGKPAGFDADFSRLLASKLSLAPVFVDTRFPDLILGMRARRFDTVASALYVTPERTKLIDFIPYLKTGASLLVLASSQYAPTGPEALCGKRVASIKGASWTPKLQKVSRETCQPKGQGEIKVLEFPTSPEAMMALRSQAADAMIEDAAVVHGMLAQSKDSLKVTSTSLLYPIVIGLGINKESKELQSALNGALQRARDSGEYQALLARYGLEEPSAAEVQAALAGPAR